MLAVAVLFAFAEGVAVALVATQFGVIPAALLHAFTRVVTITLEPDEE
jgi:transposase-like protein